MSAKFPRGGGGANPFSAIRLLSMEQCRSVNPFMPTGVFNPFKLTGRSVIIGSLVCFITLQKLLYHLSKQRRPYQTLFHSPSALCLC